jgi:hypothetical protein
MSYCWIIIFFYLNQFFFLCFYFLLSSVVDKVLILLYDMLSYYITESFSIYVFHVCLHLQSLYHLQLNVNQFRHISMHIISQQTLTNFINKTTHRSAKKYAKNLPSNFRPLWILLKIKQNSSTIVQFKW